MKTAKHKYKGHTVQYFQGEWPFAKGKYQMVFEDGSQLWTNSFKIVREKFKL